VQSKRWICVAIHASRFTGRRTILARPDLRVGRGEAKVAGTAKEVDSGNDAHRFVIDIQEAVVTRLNDAGNRLVVESWNPSRGYRS
jgi:hypothetical protein